MSPDFGGRGKKKGRKSQSPKKVDHDTMDLLRILTRGTKTKFRSNDTPLLPSAGSEPKPQLFNDGDVGATKKRKAVEDSEPDDRELDYDFFATRDQRTPAPDMQAQAAWLEPPRRKVKLSLPNEAECRQELRAHRMKLVSLLGRPSKSKRKDDGKMKEEKIRHGEDSRSAKEKCKSQFWPQVLPSFDALQDVYQVSPTLVRNVRQQGFKLPTEVQMGSLPLLLDPKTAVEMCASKVKVKRGVHFLAVAPTGSGKTLTYLLPAINGVLRRRAGQERGERKDGVHAVVVAPTRELASQIVNEGRKFALGTSVRVVLMRKGLVVGSEERDGEGDVFEGSDGGDEASEVDDQEASDSGAMQSAEDAPAGRKARARVDILVTTPKVLVDSLKSGRASKRIPTARLLVLDEADALLDPLFRKQVMGIWRSCSHPDVRLMCFSATMPSNMEELIGDELRRRRHETGRVNLIRLTVGIRDTAVVNVQHKLIYAATEAGKLMGLRQLLRPTGASDREQPLRPPFLTFCQSVDRAQALFEELKYDIAASAGVCSRLAVLHASLSGVERCRTMSRFRNGEIWVLITTDLLARGVDFAGVNGVVNYDCPTSAANYVHRAGRTGRAGRAGGVAVTFYTKEDIPFVKTIANVIAASEKQAGKAGDEATIQPWLLDALPTVSKEDKQRLKVRGVESRRRGGKSTITTMSAWERRRENNRKGAIEGSKRRKRQQERRGGGDDDGGDGDWVGFKD